MSEADQPGRSCPNLWAMHDYQDPNGRDRFKLYKMGGGALFGFESWAHAERKAAALHAEARCPCYVRKCIMCGEFNPVGAPSCAKCRRSLSQAE